MPLSHLSEEEINQVVKLYEAGEKVADIAQRYNIQLQYSNSLAPLLPPRVIKGKLCPYCNNPMRQKVSRSNTHPIYCPMCNHKEGYCSCTNCRNAKYKKSISARDAVLNVQKTSPFHFNNLTPIQKLYLSVLMTNHMGTGLIRPIDGCNLTPSIDKQLIEELYFNEIIHISSQSPLTAFPVNQRGQFYPFEVVWQSNVLPSEMTKEFHIPENEASKLWKMISFAEVTEYLIYQMGLIKQMYEPSDTTREIISSMLEVFSTSQMYSIIWSSLNYSNRCFTEGKMRRKDFTMHVVKACKRYADRALAENWKVKYFNRCKQHPQSQLSRIFFSHIGVDGFILKASDVF